MDSVKLMSGLANLPDVKYTIILPTNMKIIEVMMAQAKIFLDSFINSFLVFEISWLRNVIGVR